MAAATAINAEAFTNQDMAENNSANCQNANGLATNTWTKRLRQHLSNENDETQGRLTNYTFNNTNFIKMHRSLTYTFLSVRACNT